MLLEITPPSPVETDETPLSGTPPESVMIATPELGAPFEVLWVGELLELHPTTMT
jgi:hypothetical protein